MRFYQSLVVIFLGISLSQAQNFHYGIQGGTNYNFSGDLVQHIQNDTPGDVIHRAKTIQGYHGGVWLKYGEDTFVKTELIYSKFGNEFEIGSTTYTLTQQKLDIPLVLGIQIAGPLYIFAGPDFQYIMHEDFSIENSDISYKHFTTGVHLGVGVKHGRFALDLRWDRGLADSESSLVNSEFVHSHFTLDNRPNQLLLSLHIDFSK